MNGSSDQALSTPDPDHGPELNSRSERRQEHDWSASLNLVHKAGLSLREAEDQTQKLVARAQAILERANQELEAAYEGIAAAEERARAAEERAERTEALMREAEERAELAESRAKAAEARAQLAEGRAKEAEDWLQRMHEAIVNEFSLQGAAAAQGGVAADAGAQSFPSERNSDVILMRQPLDARKLRSI